MHGEALPGRVLTHIPGQAESTTSRCLRVKYHGTRRTAGKENPVPQPKARANYTLCLKHIRHASFSF